MLKPPKTTRAAPPGGIKPRPAHSGARSGTARIGPVALLFAVLAGLAVGCGGQGAGEQPSAGSETTQGAQAGSATLNEVLDNPGDYYGQTATLTGEITQTLSPQTFEVGGQRNVEDLAGAEDRYGENADGLLVVANLDEISGAPEVSVGDTVRVAGTVRPFDLREIEEELGEDLRGAVLTYYASQPLLIATSIEPAGGGTTAR